VLLGPTAVGKSGIALRIAREMGLEIVSCDSRQIYKFMDIGTAKPGPGDLASVKHWMIDVVDPSEEYSAFRFAAEASGIIRKRAEEGKTAIMCGGTGLYFQAISSGLGPGVGADPEIRKRYTDMAALQGKDAVWNLLNAVDPEAAAESHASNLVRNIRALEVFETLGAPLSELKKRAEPPEDFMFLVLILTLPRPVLYDRINRRVDEMAKLGLWDEFCVLRRRGYDKGSPGFRCVGYKELFDVEEHTTDLQTAMDRVRQNTRHYAKRQLTWFRNQVKGVTVDLSNPAAPASISRAVSDFLRP